MSKTSKFFEQIYGGASFEMTPIRDYEHDYFHINDNKLPRFLKGNKKLSQSSASVRREGFKRPATLDLTNIGQPLTKKINSPLNLNNFKRQISISTETDNGKRMLCSMLETLYHREKQYSRWMFFANTVYRRALHENVTHKNRFFKLDSHEELLLFGNIDTISSISDIFINSLESFCLRIVGTQEFDEETWREIKRSSSLQKIIFRSYELGDIFQQHLSRMKSTYLSYAVSHQKQMDLFRFIKNEDSRLFQQWQEHCLKAAEFKSLESILELPITRILDWVEALESMLAISDDTISDNLKEKIQSVYEQFLKFKETLTEEMSEYNSHKEYDFALTPGEIIQGYNAGVEVPKIQKGKDYLDVTNHLNDESAKSFVDHSSSYYPSDVEEHFQESINSSLGASSVLEMESIANLTLPETIVKFKLVYKDLISLESMLKKNDLFAILDVNLKNATLWEGLLKGIPPFEDTSDPKSMILSVSSSYVNKLHQQKEQMTFLKLIDLETGVMAPLNTIIKHCDSVRTKLKDLKTLKRDYILYLKEKKAKAHDIKTNLIGKHYEELQNQLTIELPKLLMLINKITGLVILNYSKFMLQYFKTMCGGEKFLERDLANREKCAGDLAPNFDILQSYSSSRYYMKRLVRKDWKFDGEPGASRVVRKLFEL
ncbi:hypothetical protein KAFR_0B03430 [Kazachstania africana CBS 2517]|uniref:DH domain-containing protein n=1 Tax=Kazachstania africana (strain ATCC 22294 / BCRC 22015 / CBS 2517 / CECT 1963 / NBRC 1671 / NRRL Y-8276) TaxID=1071382 RepID=H2AQJ0_KAZAF|nr:hypothetical protein KAFR_0B03430 [Kazachstania africana CBS 2517]CCF56640.1 hypothetical protein KAFR_0B03430 [Kazachstania africana CBS 2517]